MSHWEEKCEKRVPTLLRSAVRSVIATHKFRASAFFLSITHMWLWRLQKYMEPPKQKQQSFIANRTTIQRISEPAIVWRQCEDGWSQRSLILNIIYYRNEFHTRCKRSHGAALTWWEFNNSTRQDAEYKWNCFSGCTLHNAPIWIMANKRTKKMSIVSLWVHLLSHLQMHLTMILFGSIQCMNTLCGQIPLVFSIARRNVRAIIPHVFIIIFFFFYFNDKSISNAIDSRLTHAHNFRF